MMPVENSVIAVALQVLSDGKLHTAEDILEKGKSLGLFDDTTSRKHVYTDIYEYIARTQGLGRTPDIIQDDSTKAFRLNRPVDSWPAIDLPPLPRFIEEDALRKLIADLQTTAVGPDPAAFEVSVCAAFSALGFRATHFGGHGQPDGILDAPLGVDGFRIVLECKTATAGGVVSNPRPEEPDGFRSEYQAGYALLIGPDFGNELSFHRELEVHRVSAWTVADLCAMLQAQVTPYELESALAPGVAKPACDLLLWNRDHGRRKRIAVIAQTIWQALWKLQFSFAGNIVPANSPHMNREALTVIVDEALVNVGVQGGAAPDECDAAIAELLAVGIMVKSKNVPDSYIITEPPPVQRTMP